MDLRIEERGNEARIVVDLMEDAARLTCPRSRYHSQ
jgi:hypothetical protein